VSSHLTHRYTNIVGSFVTAFYCIYDPATRQLSYSSAGHNPPRLKRCAGGEIRALDGAAKYPLGIFPDVAYEDATVQVQPGDQLIFYTDGIVEAVDPADRMFGVGRLDGVLAECRDEPSDVVDAMLGALERFTAGQPATDDQTLVVAKIV
jgi:sigma-B regulation protein RsbU (phosphoserine phosphatase)